MRVDDDAKDFDRWFASLTLEGRCPRTGIVCELVGARERTGVRHYKLQLGERKLDWQLDLDALRDAFDHGSGPLEAMCIIMSESDFAAEELGYVIDVDALEARVNAGA